MTTYVYFIGGTGARVLRSLTMLLASGVSIGRGNSIVPIIIDYDAENGDLKRSRELLASYNILREKAAYDKEEYGFFHTPIDFKTFSAVNIKVEDKKKIFGDYINYDSLPFETRKFLETLYDNSNIEDPRTELNLNLEVGFKGNPNIGSVVFNDYFRKTEYGYNEFKSSYPDSQDGSRVFIVGSIFGGTGSSGLPQLVKQLRSCDKKSLKEAPIGACVVLPYFKVNSDSSSAIDSETFNSKAKAALTYYEAEINKELNEIYYIGCEAQKDGQEPYKNIQGGKNQQNSAHLVELLSAMSVIEFAKRDVAAMVKGKTFYEYTTTTGIETDKENKYGWLKPSGSYLDLLGASMSNDISKESVYANYVHHMNAFAYFSAYCNQRTFKKKETGFAIFKTLNWVDKDAEYFARLGNGINPETAFGRELKSFIDAFIAWSKELETNEQLKFFPYAFDKEGLDYVVNISSYDQKITKSKLEPMMRSSLNKESQYWKNKGIVEGEEGKVFIHIGSKAALDIADEINNK